MRTFKFEEKENAKTFRFRFEEFRTMRAFVIRTRANAISLFALPYLIDALDDVKAMEIGTTKFVAIAPNEVYYRYSDIDALNRATISAQEDVSINEVFKDYVPSEFDTMKFKRTAKGWTITRIDYVNC